MTATKASPGLVTTGAGATSIPTNADVFTKGSDINSASPLVVPATANVYDVTGTTGFAAMNVAAGLYFILQFDAALVLTHHATNLDLPGGAPITTAAGDVATFFATGTNTVQCVSYTRADGTAVVVAAPALEFVSTTAITAATTIEVNNFAAGYDYIVQLESFCPTDDAEKLYLLFSDDAGSSFESASDDYAWGGSKNGVPNFDVSDAKIVVTDDQGNDSGNQSTITMTFINPNATSEKTSCIWSGYWMDAQAAPVMVNTHSGGLFRQGTNAVEDIQFSWSGGSTFKAQGDVTVWRRKRS